MMNPQSLLPLVSSQNSQLTRQGRRLYVGNVPAGVTSHELLAMFNQTTDELNPNSTLGCALPAISCQVNPDKQFAFVEFRTIEEASKALALDGMMVQGQPVKVRRPNDYNPGLMGGAGVGGMPTMPGVLPGMAGMQGMAGIPGMQGMAGMAGLQQAMAGMAGMQGMQGMAGMAGMQGMAGMAGMTGMPVMGQPAAAPAGVPSCVVELNNMVTAAELVSDDDYQDVVDDVTEECEKFGKVEKVVVPRPVDGQDVAGVGKIYVKFGTQVAAGAALLGLNGRSFAGRTVGAVYYDEQLYSATFHAK